MAKKVYAVKEGFDSKNNKKIENLIVSTWAECLSYVKGVKGAKYKSFENMDEAKKFLSDTNGTLKKEDNNYPKDCLHIYVDGSYNVATEEYSYGMVAVKDDVVLNIESGVGKGDSSRNIRQIAGELEGAIKGVEYALNKGEEKVVIFHDYIGICYHATGFWERKEESSKQYYEKMQSFMNKGMEIVFVKVDSHTGDLFNELVDEKCKEKLGIDSDKIVAKWLKTNVIKVANEEVKIEIEAIAPAGEENIILEDRYNSNNYNEIKSIDIIGKVNDIMKKLSKEQQDNVLKYVQKLLNNE